MKNKKLIIGCLVGVGVIGIAIAFWGQKKSIDIPPYILQIFPTSTIRTQVEGTQYLIDSTEYLTEHLHA